MQKRTFTPIFFLLVFLSLGFNSFATTYYLSSSSGNDNNSGTSSSSPWRSISKLNSFRNFQPGDAILFERGDTFYGSITITNSGSSGNPITLGAYGSGNKPVITGFTSVTSWNSLGSNIWESAGAVSSSSAVNMVAVNGANTAMGRYPNSTGPNTGYLTINSYSGTSSISGSGLGSTNWSGASVVIRKTKYYLDRGTVNSQSGSTLYYSGNSMTPQNGDGFFIQDDPRTLDMSGEWYYNPSTKKIRIYSYSTPSSVQVASVESLLNISGSYVTVDNLSLTGGNTNDIYISYSSNHDVVVQNCDISFAGVYGIYCDQPYVTIKNNTMTNMNSDAIKLVRPNGLIQGNTIRAVNVFEGMGQNTAMGGICVDGANTTIQNNEIDSCGFKGIIFNGTNTMVKNNFINTYCFVREDGAAIYTGNTGSSGSTIDGNIILNGVGAKRGTSDSLNNDLSGISIDDYGTGITISNNSIANCVSIGIKLHLANNIVLKNNTTFDNGGSSWSKGGLEILYNSSYPINNITLNGNVFVAKNSDQLPFFASSAGNTSGIKSLNSNNNYFAKPIDPSKLILIDNNSFDLPGWQSYTGLDAQSQPLTKTVSSVSDLVFEYNPTAQSKTIALNANYIDVKNNSYNGSITLAPYSSAVLIKNGAATASTNLLPAVNPSNPVNGLDYKYYEASSYSALPDFSSATPVKTGTTSSYDISVANRNYSYALQYNGYVDVPADGQYTFYTTSDDGSNLYIDGVLVVNNDGEHAAVEKSGTIGLKAGKHSITVGFFQQGGGNSLSVSYAGPNLSKQVIPNSALYRSAPTTSDLLPAVNVSNPVNGVNYNYYEAGSYSALPDFSSITPVSAGTVQTFDIDVAQRNYSYAMQFNAYIDVPADGQYTFYTTSDDGSNLYIDGVPVVNNDGLHPNVEQSGTIGLKAGKHAITVGYFQQGGGNFLSVSYAGPGVSKQTIPASALYKSASNTSGLMPAVNPSNIVSGLNYSYYESSSYSSLPNFSSVTPVRTGTLATFDISVAQRSYSYAMQFNGYIDVPADGQYTFYTTSDDGSNLYIDGVPVVNNDGIHPNVEQSGTIGLKAGKHVITVGYFQQGGGNFLAVSYAGPGISKQPVPSTSLYRNNSLVAQAVIPGSTTISTTSAAMFNMNDSTNFQMEKLLSSRNSGSLSVKTYPNPFRDYLRVNLSGGSAPSLKLSLLDATGKTIWLKEVGQYDGLYETTVNTSGLPIGIYFLSYTLNGKSNVIKLLKEY